MFSKLFKKKKIISDKDQAHFHELQSQIYNELGGVLISITPEHWNSATLELVYNGDTLAHSIISDEGHRDIVTASPEIFDITKSLQDSFTKYSSMFKFAKFKVWQNEQQEWQFNVEYKYDENNPR